MIHPSIKFASQFSFIHKRYLNKNPFNKIFLSQCFSFIFCAWRWKKQTRKEQQKSRTMEFNCYLNNVRFFDLWTFGVHALCHYICLLPARGSAELFIVVDLSQYADDVYPKTFLFHKSSTFSSVQAFIYEHKNGLCCRQKQQQTAPRKT